MAVQKHAVAVIIRNSLGQILLLRRGPKARSEIGLWENIGGAVEAPESESQAAKREVMEELGVDLVSLDPLLHAESPENSQGIIWHTDVFSGQISGTPCIQEPNICSEISWFSREDLPYLPLASFTRSDFIYLGWLPSSSR